MTIKVGFENIHISRFGPMSVYTNFFVDINFADLFREMGSLNYWNLMKNFIANFDNILVLSGHSKGP
jgi:hypothetical protein